MGNGVSPTVSAGSHGYSMGSIVRLDDQSEFDRDKECRRVDSSAGIGPCLSSSGSNEINISTPKIRRLTTTECARLQGFPDDWCEGLSDTQQYKCYGNAVTTKVIEAIARRLLDGKK